VGYCRMNPCLLQSSSPVRTAKVKPSSNSASPQTVDNATDAKPARNNTAKNLAPTPTAQKKKKSSSKPVKNAQVSEDYNALSELIVTPFQNGLKKSEWTPKAEHHPQTTNPK
jgi:hypothetical protein